MSAPRVSDARLAAMRAFGAALKVNISSDEIRALADELARLRERLAAADAARDADAEGAANLRRDSIALTWAHANDDEHNEDRCPICALERAHIPISGVPLDEVARALAAYDAARAKERE